MRGLDRLILHNDVLRGRLELADGDCDLERSLLDCVQRVAREYIHIDITWQPDKTALLTVHRHLILDRALDDVLAVLAILRRDHLIGNEGYLAELELLGVLLELDGLVLFRVDSILSIANRLRGLVVSRVV